MVGKSTVAFELEFRILLTAFLEEEIYCSELAIERSPFRFVVVKLFMRLPVNCCYNEVILAGMDSGTGEYSNIVEALQLLNLSHKEREVASINTLSVLTVPSPKLIIFPKLQTG